MDAFWNKGIGAVTRRNRNGFTQRAQRMALYQCKLAQFYTQEGLCGICGIPMDPKYAVWANPRKMKCPSLAKWATGQTTEFNLETGGFDENPRSPDEILAEYDAGRAGYCLYHPRCMGKWRAKSPGMHPGGPAWRREFDKVLKEGYDPGKASTLAYDRLREQNLVTLAKARANPKRMEAWLTAMELGKGKKSATSRSKASKKKASTCGNEPVGPDWTTSNSDANLRAEQEYESTRPETDLERRVREMIPAGARAALGY